MTVHDGKVPKPRLAWLFRPGIEGIPREGTLSISDDGAVLDFEGANGRPFLLPVADIRKVKRLRASPVLQVRYPPRRSPRSPSTTSRASRAGQLAGHADHGRNAGAAARSAG